jgi:hypothetical protein
MPVLHLQLVLHHIGVSMEAEHLDDPDAEPVLADHAQLAGRGVLVELDGLGRQREGDGTRRLAGPPDDPAPIVQGAGQHHRLFTAEVKIPGLDLSSRGCDRRLVERRLDDGDPLRDRRCVLR